MQYHVRWKVLRWQNYYGNDDEFNRYVVVALLVWMGNSKRMRQ